MITLSDCFGNKVRITAERLAHILEHLEMNGMTAEIQRVLREPQLVRRSRSDAAVRLFYESMHGRFWVANGCALWLGIRRTMHLWSRRI
jgi:hypothetical protein